MSARAALKAEEAHILKEIVFIDTRWRRFRHDMMVVQAGDVRVIVNGLSSVHYSLRMYLDERRDRALLRLNTVRKRLQREGTSET